MKAIISKIGSFRAAPIVYLILLLLCLTFAGWSRVQSVNSLEGKYLLGTDAYRFFRQASVIDQNGKLPKKDMMRWLPEGRDLSVYPTASAYSMAYLAQLVQLFASISLYQVAVYYPVLCYLLALLTFYLLVKDAFDSKVALLSLLLMTLLPQLLLRSTAGFADRDAFVLFQAALSSYCYLRRIRASSHLKQWGWNFGFAVVMILLGLTWEGVGLFLNLFVGIWLIKFLMSVYRWENFCLDLGGFALVVLGLLTLTDAYRGIPNYSSPYVFFTFAPASLFFLMAVGYFAINRFPNLSRKSTLHDRLPLELSVGTVLFATACSVCLLVLMTEDISHLPALIQSNFLSILGQSRLMESVEELSDTTFMDWVALYQFLLLLVVGEALLLLYRLCKTLRLNPWLLMGSFQLILIGVVYYHSLDAAISASEEIANVFYLVAIGLFLLLGIGNRLYHHWHKRTISQEDWTVQSEAILWCLNWFMLLLFAARGAGRYHFFLAPVATILASYAFIELLRFIFGKPIPSTVFLLTFLALFSWIVYFYQLANATKPIPILLFGAFLFLCLAVIMVYRAVSSSPQYRTLAFIILILFFSINLNESMRQHIAYAQQIRPMASQAWREALDWMRENLDAKAVIAARWAYGGQINVLSGKATIIDEDHYIPYWIHLMDRHVFHAQTETEALEFLKTHNASHLIFTAGDLENVETTSFVASDQNYIGT
jgi:asparagine N-glycosylation enzyme membrane subunit Stt3